ncbi:MAG TPA: phytanoyl-CoA dioxygenase family protein [Pirellulales bacterium]|nr:phytanoyl-CoA dioxygenase family protein [Pirellulales bacterium]
MIASAALNSPPLSASELDDFRRLGFVVRRRVFAPDEMAELAAEAERLLSERSDLIDPKNLRCRYMARENSGEPLFDVFDPVNDISPVCERFTSDARIVGLVDSIYGEPCSLFKEKLIFKLPGAMGYHLHQDIPRTWEGFPRSFLTALVPIDRPSDENGCTEIFTGYHHDFIVAEGGDHYHLPDDCVDLARRVKLLLEPGDVAIFHGLTPHRSGPNRSTTMRRAFYISYNARGEGGDQHDFHYREFHAFMRKRLAPDESKSMYFR